MFGPLAFLFLIFPTGQPRISAVGLGAARDAGRVRRRDDRVRTDARVPRGGLRGARPSRSTNPIGLPLAWKQAIETITTVAGLIVAAGALLSVVSLIQRYRRAAQLERQQIRWLAFLGVFLGMILVLSFGLIATGAIDDEGVVSGLAFFAFIFGVFLGIPAVCGIAILRHGLWDLDVVDPEDRAVRRPRRRVHDRRGPRDLPGAAGSDRRGGQPRYAHDHGGGDTRGRVHGGPVPSAPLGEPDRLRQAVDPVRGPVRVRGARRGDLLDGGRPPADGSAPR